MKSFSIKRILCYIILAALVIAAVVLGSIILPMNEEVQRVRSLTPTPLPLYGSVF